MTMYQDFIEDFPDRCGKLLQCFYEPAKRSNLEITLLIMTAMSSFMIPYERIGSGASTSHQGKDTENFRNKHIQIKSILSKSYKASSLFGGKSWRIAKLKGDFHEYPKLNEIKSNVYTSEILAIIRNALAHGNIRIKNSPVSQIEGILLWTEWKNNSKPKELVGYRYIYVTPDDLHSFIMCWIKFLKETGADVARGAISDAVNNVIDEIENSASF